METETITTTAHTTPDGKLALCVDLGMPDSEVSVVLHVKLLSPAAENSRGNWPPGYFDNVPGSMPDLKRMPQGEFEERPLLE